MTTPITVPNVRTGPIDPPDPATSRPASAIARKATATPTSNRPSSEGTRPRQSARTSARKLAPIRTDIASPPTVGNVGTQGARTADALRVSRAHRSIVPSGAQTSSATITAAIDQKNQTEERPAAIAGTVAVGPPTAP